jgi:hypothetical protein
MQDAGEGRAAGKVLDGGRPQQANLSQTGS